MFRSSTVMVTSMVVLLEMMMTVSPLFTSCPSTRLQEVTVPSMGAVAWKLARALTASSSFFWAWSSCSCLARISVSRVEEPRVRMASPADTLA